jgi:hypothetical protein
VQFQRFCQILFDFYDQGRRFEDFGEGTEAHDPGFDLFGAGRLETQLQGTVLELFVFLARVPAALQKIAGQRLVKATFTRTASSVNMPKLWRR